MSKDYTTDVEYWVFRKIIDINPTPVLITDKKARIVYINEEFSNVTGYSKSELIGKSPNILKSGEHPDSFYKNLWETIQSGKTWIGEICNKKKNGEIYCRFGWKIGMKRGLFPGETAPLQFPSEPVIETALRQAHQVDVEVALVDV